MIDLAKPETWIPIVGGPLDGKLYYPSVNPMADAEITIYYDGFVYTPTVMPRMLCADYVYNSDCSQLIYTGIQGMVNEHGCDGVSRPSKADEIRSKEVLRNPG